MLHKWQRGWGVDELSKVTLTSDVRIKKRLNKSRAIRIFAVVFVVAFVVALCLFIVPSAKSYHLHKQIFTTARVTATAASLASLIALLTFIATQRRTYREARQRRKEDPKRAVLSANLQGYNPENGCPIISAVSKPLSFGISPALVKGRDSRMDRVYVPRDIDDELDAALKNSAFVLLVGESKSGKSRSAYEGVRRCFPERALVLPARPSSLEALTSAGIDFSSSVIWLDDLERYLVPEGLDDYVLSKLMTTPEVTIVATMRSRIHAQYMPEGSKNPPEWRPLQTANHVRLQRLLTKAEIVRASAILGNPNLKLYFERYGLAEYLSAAPDLRNRFEDARESKPAGWAIVRAVIELARCGLPVIGSEPVNALAMHYMSDFAASTGTLEEAWNWAQEAIYGASALLSKQEKGFRPFDYLVDYVEKESESIPDAAWESALAEATAGQLLSVGFSAQNHKRFDVAEGAFQRVAASEDERVAAEGNFALALLRLALGDPAKAIRFLQKSRKSGFAPASDVLAQLAIRRHKIRQAEVYYREVFEAIPPHGAHELGDIAAQRGRRDEARDWYERGAAAGSGPCAAHIGDMEIDEGNFAKAEEAYRTAMKQGVSNSADPLADALVQQGKWEEAIELLTLRAEAGVENAASHLAYHLEMEGNLKEAERWNRISAERGEMHGNGNVGLMLAKRGRRKRKEAISWLNLGHEERDYRVSTTLARLLESRGDFAKAMQVLESAVRGGWHDAENDLAILLMARGPRRRLSNCFWVAREVTIHVACSFSRFWRILSPQE